VSDDQKLVEQFINREILTGVDGGLRRALLRLRGIEDALIRQLVPEPPDGLDYSPKEH
jgi:hypothetical protein